MVDLVGSYVALQQKEFASLNKAKSYEDYFLGQVKSYAEQVGQTLSQNVSALSQEASTAKRQTAYDISGAYSNYMAQQRNLSNVANITEGYKQRLGESLQGQYQSTFAKEKQEEATTIGAISKKQQSLTQQAYEDVGKYQEDVQKSKLEVDKTIALRAKKFADIETAAINYYNTQNVGGEALTINDFQKLGYTDPEGNITDKGIEFFDKIFNYSEGDKGFASYLQEQNKTDLLDFYYENLTDVKTKVGGLKATDTSWERSDRTRKVEFEDVKKQLVDKGYTVPTSATPTEETIADLKQRVSLIDKYGVDKAKDSNFYGTLNVEFKGYRPTSILQEYKDLGGIKASNYDHMDVVKINGSYYYVNDDFTKKFVKIEQIGLGESLGEIVEELINKMKPKGIEKYFPSSNSKLDL